MTLSNEQKILAKNIYGGVVVRGTRPDGKPGYAYYAVRADKMEAFREHLESEGKKPQPEGVVFMESGVGEPSDEVKKRMYDEYKFSEDFVPDLLELAKNLEEKTGT